MRRGYPALPHPTENQEGHAQACCLHLPVEEVPRDGDRQGADADDEIVEPDTPSFVEPAQPGSSWLVQLLPPRRVLGNLRLPRRLHLAASHSMDPPTARRYHLGGAPPTLSQWVAAGGGRGATVRHPDGDGHSIPLPGVEHHLAVVEHAVGENPTARLNGSRRAGCAEMRTSGSEGGPGKQTS